MSNSNVILVPIGFTDQSLVALEQAVNIAKLTNSTLNLLHVFYEPSSFSKLFSTKNEIQVEKYKSEIIEKLDALKEHYCKDISRVECMISAGKIYEEIVNVADMTNAKLIVMGTDGSSKNNRKKFIGSNASNVVRSAPCPVITIKGKEQKQGCDSILLPLDLHKETKEKVTTAIQYARLWNADIKIVSIAYTKDQDEKNILKRNINQVQTFIDSKGIPCSSSLIEVDGKGDMPKALLNFAIEKNVDLIMIMTQSESGFILNSMGSHARFIINNFDIPIMSIRPSLKRDTMVIRR